MTPNAVTVRRSSEETKVSVTLTLRGSGQFQGAVGDALLTHLLRTLVRYSGIDVTIEATGDEGHHIGEDIALTLGRALRRALPSSGVQRFGDALVPLDEALVQVALDLADRPYYKSDLPLSSMAEHVLRSLVTEARVTCHQLTLRPGEEHHVLEATYKAFGLALSRALEPSSRDLSLKGRVEWRER